MMTDNHKEGTTANGKVCVCGKPGCMCGHHDGHSYLMKWLVRLAILLVVFITGYMMGELHGMIGAYRHSYRADYTMMREGRSMTPGMMTQQQFDTTGTPVTGTTTTLDTE